jgi:hypothetical protein
VLGKRKPQFGSVKIVKNVGGVTGKYAKVFSKDPLR